MKFAVEIVYPGGMRGVWMVRDCEVKPVVIGAGDAEEILGESGGEKGFGSDGVNGDIRALEVVTQVRISEMGCECTWLIFYYCTRDVGA